MTLEVIERLKRQGLSQSQIAERFGVTKQAVSWTVRNYGGSMTPRQKATQAFPFKVPANMCSASVCKRLRDHAELMTAGGDRLSVDAKRRLRNFYERLRANNHVVEFSPDIEPIKGISGTYGGWRYVERSAEDGDLLIRVNAYCRPLTDEDRRIWSFPAEWLE